MYHNYSSGDEYFRYILDTYSDALIRLCYSYVKNMTDAEDLAEDTFCELVRSSPDFDSAEHEKAWLFRVAANKCKNHVMSARIRLSAPLDEQIIENTPDTRGNMQSDGTEYIRDEVLSLPEKYRTVLHLYYFEEMSLENIASVLRIPKATVGTRLARGRNLLKKQLGDEIDV